MTAGPHLSQFPIVGAELLEPGQVKEDPDEIMIMIIKKIIQNPQKSKDNQLWNSPYTFFGGFDTFPFTSQLEIR